jgi:hypothetical protein
LHGGHADGFVARQLRSAMVEDSHLVLGATPRHRSAVVAKCPRTSSCVGRRTR